MNTQQIYEQIPDKYKEIYLDGLYNQQPEDLSARGEVSDTHFKLSSEVSAHDEGFPADTPLE